MYGNQFDGGSTSSLFSGGGFMPSQSTQTPSSGLSKTRGAQGVLPLTVKQITEAYHSNDDKSSFAVDGVEASNVRLLGIVRNKSERFTDVSFVLDDGTGRVDVNRWINDAIDTSEMNLIKDGMYVIVSGSLKGFQGKRQVVAFSVRPVTDFNFVTLHFLECIHVHLENTRPKGNAPQAVNPNMYDVKASYQTPTSNQFSASTEGSDGQIYKMVLHLFQEPAALAREHGLHVDEVVQRLRLPAAKIRNAIAYHADVGNIYSTIDDDHYKSTCNG